MFKQNCTCAKFKGMTVTKWKIPIISVKVLGIIFETALGKALLTAYTGDRR